MALQDDVLALQDSMHQSVAVCRAQRRAGRARGMLKRLVGLNSPAPAIRLRSRHAALGLGRNGRTNSRTSAANSSGSSHAAKWPPVGACVHRTTL
jgi:hypothetical protein